MTSASLSCVDPPFGSVSENNLPVSAAVAAAEHMSSSSSSSLSLPENRRIVPQWQMRIIHYQASLRLPQPPAYPQLLLPSQLPPLSYASSAASSAEDAPIESHVSTSDSTPTTYGCQEKLYEQSKTDNTPYTSNPSTVPSSSNASPSLLPGSLSLISHSRAENSSTNCTDVNRSTSSGGGDTDGPRQQPSPHSLGSLPPAAKTTVVYYDPEEELIPPENFSMVSTNIYRSSFPRKKNFPFLASLGLKSVVSLVLEEYPGQNLKFFEDHGVKFYQFGIPGNKEPFIQIPDDIITNALVTMLDTRNYPMLVHCNKGKHRTGCLVGCFRKLQKWAATSIFDEYLRFAFPKSRSMDQQFIELYDTSYVWKCVDRAWLPPWVDGMGI